ncbi:hypothetical protein KIN20_022354 [Parelaphostrongylus tenuis]|uniref:Uncharacterized protein n=1 Tax=Parelaphostrongylus tenuis TaxID=148309 RepID=A0AAD5N7X6_PARTN|nr:hypothetical protein KIN20_022354 [Parelaphostrongylus tenuis]
MENADHVDKVLDTISLHDGSLVVLEGEQISDSPSDQRLCSPSMLPTMKSGKENGQSIATGSINRSELPRVGVGKGKLREELDSYFRMKRRLYDLQLVLLQLKKRSASTPKQAEKFEKLFKAASEDYRNAVNQASSWLERRVPQKELLKFIKTRQRQLCAETEECANTIKKFLNSEITSAQKNSEDACSSLNEITRLQNGRRDSAVRINTEALNKSVDCDIWNLSARSMRRNLEARREQAEILNRSFEEMSKDIEKRTKESIAAQIIQYDRVIAERADLITQLDRISSQDKSLIPPEISTPRRDGVEPLDLAQLSSQASLSDDGRTSKSKLVASPVAANAQPTDQNEAEEGINCRSHSHSTVYEDSVSHLGDGDENESCQPCSEDTIFEDSQEKHVPDGFEKENPSRRTLDAAEILATLSHHVVIMPTSDSSKNDVEQSIGNVVEEMGSQKMAVNEATRFDSKREAPEAEKIMVGIDSDADAAILAKSVNIDDDKDQAEILPTLTNDERGSCGDASYTQENISVDVSFAEFHQSEAKGKLTITEKGGSLIVTSPVTVKEKRATDLSADLIPTSSPRSKVSQLELLSDGSHESTERSHSPQYQNYRQDTAMILGEAVHVTERIENADQTTETAAMFEEGDEKAIPNDFVSRGPIPAQKIHDLTRAEICDELSSSITQSLETTSPRRRSCML